MDPELLADMAAELSERDRRVVARLIQALLDEARARRPRQPEDLEREREVAEYMARFRETL